MPGEKEAKVGSSAHLAASTTKTTTTIVPSLTSSITVKSPSVGATTAGNTTTTTCHNTSQSSIATSPPNTTLSSSSTPGLIPGPPGKKVAPIVNVNVNPSNRLSQVSLKKSEDGSLSVSIVDANKEQSRNAADTDDEEDGSKMELELTFAGIDNETVELELEEDDNNIDSNGKGHSGSPSGGSGQIIIPSGGGDRRMSPEGLGRRTSVRGPGSVNSPGSRVGSVTGLESVTGPTGSVGGVVGATTAETMDEEEDEDIEGGKTVECTEVIVPIQTLAEKCLFYVTAFFILLAIFSLFAFLFLVPFVIDPAFTTIFMEFDPEPAFCLTVSNVALEGLSNCNWTSCREGCTREIFKCNQIRVNYRRAKGPYPGGGDSSLPPGSSSSSSSSPWATNTAAGSSSSNSNNVKSKNHYQQNSNHLTNSNTNNKYAAYDPGRSSGRSYSNKKLKHKLTPSELTKGGSVSDGWDYNGAHLFPNVKGCGYPPVTVCDDFYAKYGTEGTNFSCYYSKVDRGLVVTKYDMTRVILELVYSMAIPIPSFIISVVYLIFAYFRLYNTDSSSSAHRRASTLNVNQSSTNNNIQAATAGGSMGDPDGDTSLSADEKTQIIHKSTSRGLNTVDKLVPNSGKGIHSQVIEMNDLNPQLHNPADGDLLLPRRNNRAPERNGPANPAAKNKGEMNSNGQNGSHRTETEKYLEPGVLPEKNTMLPPIELPPPPPPSTKKSCKQMTMKLT